MPAATNRADLIAMVEKAFTKLAALLEGWLVIWPRACLKARDASGGGI